MPDHYKVRIALILAGTAFVGSWLYCVVAYGFLFGVGLGWLPSAIVSVPTFYLALWLWRFAAFVLFVAAVCVASVIGYAGYLILIHP
jgi:hypothetical protein